MNTEKPKIEIEPFALAQKLTEAIQKRDKPSLNTRMMLSDPSLWNEVATAIMEAVDNRLQEIVADEPPDEEVMGKVVEKLAEPPKAEEKKPAARKGRARK